VKLVPKARKVNKVLWVIQERRVLEEHKVY